MAKTVAAEEFETHPRELLHEVKEKQEELVVMEDGQPLATIVPSPRQTDLASQLQQRTRALEKLRGSVQTLGDIVEPLDEEWDVMK